MIPVIISGACGRMGKAIIQCAMEHEDMEVVGALERPGHESLGKTVSEVCEISGCEVVLTDDPASVKEKKAVLIEFTSPEATMKHLESCLELGRPMMIGTTALDANQLERVKKAGEKIPIVLASNTSVGVNLLFNLVHDAAKALGNDYDAEIFEVHHRFKKDAPSGTAKSLAESVAGARNQDPEKDIIYGRHGIVGERKSGEIGVHAIRAGDVVGEHTVIFSTLGERIELTHRCHNRIIFARGAIRAAAYLHDQKPGFYDMRDVIGLGQK